MKIKAVCIFSVLASLILFGACSLFTEETFLEAGKHIRFVFDAGLNEDSRFKLPKDANGFYYMTLTKPG
ncbi:MAG: hypothetical protein O3A40_09395 [Bacteroidetes bacterium]|nr:hypothetical protein [Bacteroidota bacterium]